MNKVYDWFETIPFHKMTSRHDLVSGRGNDVVSGSGGIFCLANEGQEYYIYMESKGNVTLYLDFPYMLNSEWINAQNTNDKRPGPSVNQRHVFNSPEDGDDWILHVFVP